jgi:hypothetical protein
LIWNGTVADAAALVCPSNASIHPRGHCGQYRSFRGTRIDFDSFLGPAPRTTSCCDLRVLRRITAFLLSNIATGVSTVQR